MIAVRWFIRITATIIAVTFLFIGIAGLIIGTETGTRWLLGQAPGYVPGSLTLTTPSGSLLRGVRFESFSWRDESTSVAGTDVLVAVDLLPLVRRRVNIREFAAGRLEVSVTSGAESGEPESDVYVDLPVVIAVEDARLDEFVLQLDESTYPLSDVGFAISLQGPRLAIAQLGATGFDIRVDLSGRIRLEKDLPSRLQAGWRTVNTEPVLAGTLTLAGDMNAYGIEHALAEPVVVATDGVLRLAGDRPFVDVSNRWDAIEYGVSGRTIATPGGSLGIVGPLDSLGIDLDTTASFDTYPATAIELVATLTGFQAAAIDRLSLDN